MSGLLNDFLDNRGGFAFEPAEHLFVFVTRFYRVQEFFLLATYWGGRKIIAPIEVSFDEGILGCTGKNSSSSSLAHPEAAIVITKVFEQHFRIVVVSSRKLRAHLSRLVSKISIFPNKVPVIRRTVSASSWPSLGFSARPRIARSQEESHCWSACPCTPAFKRNPVKNFGKNPRHIAVITSDKALLCQLEARPDCRARDAAPLPAIERIRHTPRRCPDRSRPDRPTRGSRTNTGGAVRASHWPDESQSSY